MTENWMPGVSEKLQGIHDSRPNFFLTFANDAGVTNHSAKPHTPHTRKRHSAVTNPTGRMEWASPKNLTSRV